MIILKGRHTSVVQELIHGGFDEVGPLYVKPEGKCRTHHLGQLDPVPEVLQIQHDALQVHITPYGYGTGSCTVQQNNVLKKPCIHIIKSQHVLTLFETAKI